MNRSLTNNYEFPLLDGDVLDVSTGDVRKRNPSDLYTKTFNIRKPSKNKIRDEERFKRFFNAFFSDRWEIAQYVMELIVLFYTADMSHKSFVIAEGPSGNNGKSCLRRCISALAPEFQSSINKGLVLKTRSAKDYRAASNEITNLGNGIRIGFTDELCADDTFDVRSIKEFAGQTEMAMRRNYEDTTRGWSHECCLWLNTNCIPTLQSCDTAFRRRCIIIEFLSVFTDKPVLEEEVEDFLGVKHRAEYQKDPATEK